MLFNTLLLKGEQMLKIACCFLSIYLYLAFEGIRHEGTLISPFNSKESAYGS